MTLRIGIAGIRGRMGREIVSLAVCDPDVTVVGGLTRPSALTEVNPNEIPIFMETAKLLADVDVLIDFSTPEGTVAHASSCASAGVPLVCGTTGLDETHLEELHKAAKRVAVFHAPNMSPAVNAIIAVLPLLVRGLHGYDIEIVEAHHRHKVDAPSGTALALAQVIVDSDVGRFNDGPTFGREGACLRSPAEIGIHAVRAGGNTGEHTVILAGDGEEVRISHRAFNRTAYAEGALRAARLIASQVPGWYEPATLPGFL